MQNIKVCDILLNVIVDFYCTARLTISNMSSCQEHEEDGDCEFY